MRGSKPNLVRIWVTFTVIMAQFCGSANAEVALQDLRIWRRAKVISGGQHVWALQTSRQKIKDRFGTNGKIEPLGQQYSRRLTWDQVVRAENTVSGKDVLRDYMRQQGLNDNSVAATLDYELERTENGFAMDWAHGMTDGWMIGFHIPVVYRQTKINSRLRLADHLATLAASQQQGPKPSGETQVTMEEKVNKLAQQELVNSGYDQVPNEKNSWDWGDISLLSQFNLAQSYRWNWSLQQMVRIPTAQNPSLSDYIQSDDDRGQVDLGLTSLLDYRKRRWLAGLRFGYVSQLPDKVKTRVTNEETKQIQNREVSRDLGDWVWASFDVELEVTDDLDISAEHSYLRKNGDRLSSEHINSVSSDQQLQQSRFGVQYHLGETSSRSGVENKWIASAGYTYPWAGRNSMQASKTSVDIITYF